MNLIKDLQNTPWLKADARVADWPFLNSFYMAIVPPVAYLVAIYALQQFMKNRKEFIIPLWFRALHNGGKTELKFKNKK